MDDYIKVLIVLENHFYIDNTGRIWCDRIIDYNYLKRYLKVFDSVMIAGRCSKLKDNDKGKLLVSGNNVEFIALPEFIRS